MVDNIVVGALLQNSSLTPPRYFVPLIFTNPAEKMEVIATIGTSTLILQFNFNDLVNSLFLSCYTVNRTTTYFVGFKCVFSNYINEIDNGCPYKFFFVDKSNGQNYARNSEDITYEALSNGVNLYAELR